MANGMCRKSNYRYLHITYGIFSMLNWFYFVHESRSDTDRRVFDCPRMKRGAPDLRLSHAGWLG